MVLVQAWSWSEWREGYHCGSKNKAHLSQTLGLSMTILVYYYPGRQNIYCFRLWYLVIFWLFIFCIIALRLSTLVQISLYLGVGNKQFVSYKFFFQDFLDFVMLFCNLYILQLSMQILLCLLNFLHPEIHGASVLLSNEGQGRLGERKGSLTGALYSSCVFYGSDYSMFILL